MPAVNNNQKSAVVDALRAARNADDELTRVQENSWEARRRILCSLVESANWKYGPAELIATFDRHVLAKSPAGELVQVEWQDDGSNYRLGRTVVHESATPVADLGIELMETARSTVDAILEGDIDSADLMVATLAESLDTGGKLQRRIVNEVTLRSLARDAWWHNVVGEREGIETDIPAPRVEGEDHVARSVNDLLIFLKEQAGEASLAIKTLSESRYASDIESLAGDIAEDVQRAITALTRIDTTNQEEALKVYEAVMTATPRLLNGIEFLRDLVSDEVDSATAEGQE